MPHKLPELSYVPGALAPHLSQETLEIHHGRHHKTYVEKLNKLVKGTREEGAPLEELVREASGAIFNNAAQHWNHSFLWQCLSPEGEQPGGMLAEAIYEQWGSQARFEQAFAKCAVEHFGSGWAWLVRKQDGGLEVHATHDADTPLRHGDIPLLTCDLWEHAYYIDYRNERPKYVEAFWQIVNWEFVAENFSGKPSTTVADLRQAENTQRHGAR